MCSRYRRRLGHAAVVAALAVCACGDSRPRSLVVYTPLDRTTAARVERAYELDHPDVDVRIVRLADGEDLGPVRGREASEEADVWWGATIEALARAAHRDVLAPVDPTWAGATTPRDAAGRWHALPGDTPFVLAFDVREVARARAPRDWADLLHPRWTGELVLLDPAADARMRSLLGSLVVQELRRTGQEHAGFDFLRGLEGATRAYAPDVRDVFRRLEIGDGSMTILPLDEVNAARAGGRDWLEHRGLESGAPALVRGVAVLAGARDRDAAVAFVETIGADGVGAVEPHGITVWPPAPDTLAERLDAWMARWSDDVRGRARVFER